MKTTLIFCLLLCTYCSCKTDTTVKVDGVIMDSVTNTPIGNTDFIFEVAKYEGMKMEWRPTNFSTKADGTFSVSASASTSSGAYIIFASDYWQQSMFSAIWRSNDSIGRQTYFNAGVIYTRKK